MLHLPAPLLLLSSPLPNLPFSSSLPAIIRRVSPYEPSPAHGFFLVKVSFSRHCYFFGGPPLGFCKAARDNVIITEAINKTELKLKVYFKLIR